MITLNLDLTIASFLSGCLLVVFTYWIIYTYKQRGEVRQENLDQLVQCPFCNYTFYNVLLKNLIACPQCQSFIKETS